MSQRYAPKLLMDTVVLGVAGALSARLFSMMLSGSAWLFLHRLAGYTAPGLPEEGGAVHEIVGRHGLWLIPGRRSWRI